LIIRDDEKKALPMITQIFFDESSAERMKWIGKFLNKAGLPVDLAISRQGKDYGFIISKKISGFPIFEFARNFCIDRIVNRQIERMDLQLFSFCHFFQVDECFERFVAEQRLSEILIGSYDPQAMIAKDERVIALAARVFMDFSVH